MLQARIYSTCDGAPSLVHCSDYIVDPPVMCLSTEAMKAFSHVADSEEEEPYIGEHGDAVRF